MITAKMIKRVFYVTVVLICMVLVCCSCKKQESGIKIGERKLNTVLIMVGTDDDEKSAQAKITITGNDGTFTPEYVEGLGMFVCELEEGEYIIRTVLDGYTFADRPLVVRKNEKTTLVGIISDTTPSDTAVESDTAGNSEG